MSNLSSTLTKQAASLFNIGEAEQLSLLNTLYHDNYLSFREIAGLCGSNSTRISRLAKRLGIKARDKSQAQKSALASGRHKHPTKGTTRSDETKIKISEGVVEQWENLPESEKDKRRQTAKQLWAMKTPQEVEEFRRRSALAIRQASQEGSALEKSLLEGLLSAGYRVQFHKEHFVETRESLQIDLYLPEQSIAIEVDGPSHFRKIWNDEILQKNIHRDNEKNGLLLQRGLSIIRVRQTKSLSAKYVRDTLATLIHHIEQIRTGATKKRLIILGETNG